MEQLLATLKELNIYSITARIVIAVIVGGLIGSERGRHGRAAGLRTHILVCLGACMTSMIGLYVSKELGSPGDPLRMGSQVVSGIGFLGAGTIIVRHRSHITGLTTAAGLWATACIGLAVGAGFYWAVTIATLTVIVTFTLLTRFERASKQRDRGAFYVEVADIRHVNMLYDKFTGMISEMDIVQARSGLSTSVGLELFATKAQDSKALLRKLRACELVVVVVPLHV